MSTIRCAPLLFLLALTACAGITDPDRWPVEFRITGLVEPSSDAEDPLIELLGPPVLRSQSGPGQITVLGDFLLPCINYHPFAEANRQGRILTLRVDWRRENNCATETIKYSYEAVLPELEPGTYHLVVEQHLFTPAQGANGMTVVLEEDVEVP